MAVVPPETISKLRRLMELRDRRDETDTAAKKAKEEYQEAEMELFEELNEGPVASLPNVDLGEPWGKVSFRKRETYLGKVIPGMEEQALRYFEDRCMVDSVTAPKFVKKRLNEVVRQAMENNDGKMPPGIDFHPSRGVTVTQQKN